MVGFGLDNACAHIIIPASVNLLPIQADFVTERDIQVHRVVCTRPHAARKYHISENFVSCSRNKL